MLSEAPELPALLGEVRAQLSTLTEAVQPLVSNVTADLGASKDGLVYLRTRQQLLLAYCMNVCFYMILKVRDGLWFAFVRVSLLLLYCCVLSSRNPRYVSFRFTLLKIHAHVYFWGWCFRWL